MLSAGPLLRAIYTEFNKDGHPKQGLPSSTFLGAAGTGILLLMGMVLIPLGLWVLHTAETCGRCTGKLERTGCAATSIDRGLHD
ncbi:hypothetical protein SY28_09525 [Meiothermus taiwanensis]|nr:hypothetical protein SY28_09525 [Meiothermus taiwanensis]KZK16496.1 hypothetical protein A3962_06130 [Meiothermus taiwanensis]